MGLNGLDQDSIINLIRSNNYNIFIGRSLDQKIKDEITAAEYQLIEDSAKVDSVVLKDYIHPGVIKRLKIAIEGSGIYQTGITYNGIVPIDTAEVSQITHLRLLSDTARIHLTFRVYVNGSYQTFKDTTILITSDLDSFPEIVIRERKDLERWISKLVEEYHHQSPGGAPSQPQIPILIRYLEWRWWRWPR
ncbi:MAG TPA: hypothetical protein EYP24_00780 [bacterium (Candidatus Stahlbacteria)]|nr:hypothetical protein [Candidatus Stahlbacteria bacterium]